MSIIKQHLENHLKYSSQIKALEALNKESKDWLDQNLIKEISKELNLALEKKYPEIEIFVPRSCFSIYDPQENIKIFGVRLKNEEETELIFVDDKWYEQKYPFYKHNAGEVNLLFTPQELLSFCQEICALHDLKISYSWNFGYFSDQQMLESKDPQCLDDLIVLYPNAEILFSAEVSDNYECNEPIILNFIILKFENQILSFWPAELDSDKCMTIGKGLDGIKKIKEMIEIFSDKYTLQLEKLINDIK